MRSMCQHGCTSYTINRPVNTMNSSPGSSTESQSKNTHMSTHTLHMLPGAWRPVILHFLCKRYATSVTHSRGVLGCSSLDSSALAPSLFAGHTLRLLICPNSPNSLYTHSTPPCFQQFLTHSLQQPSCMQEARL